MKTTKSIAARRSTKSAARKPSAKAARRAAIEQPGAIVNFATGEILPPIFDAETGAPLTPEAEKIDAEAVAMFPPLKYVIVREDGTRRTGQMPDPRAELYRRRAPLGHKVLDGNESPSLVVVMERADDFNPTDPTAVPPFVVDSYSQPSPELAEEFAKAFNEAELKPKSEGGNKRLWAVAVDRMTIELAADEAATTTKGAE